MAQSTVTIEDIKTQCKSSIEFLCTQILWANNQPDKKLWDPIHDDIEKMLCRPARRKLILVPRGHLKSAIITKAYAVRALLRNPNIRILIANQVWDKAREMLYEIKELLTTKSILPKLFGDFVSNRWTAEEIVIKQRTEALSAATIATTGIEAETVSSHYDLIILDDIQGLTNSQTKEQRDKVKRYYSAMIDLLEQKGEMIVVGTRWHQDDVYQHIMDNESNYFDVIVRKVFEHGKFIFPHKFQAKFSERVKDWVYSESSCMDYLEYLKRSKGADFYAQYMNDPIAEENQLFKCDYFRYWQHRPEGLYTVLTVDLAIGQKQENDYTALIVSGKDNNHNIYILDYMRGHWRPSDVVDIIFQMRAKWNPDTVGIEVNGFQRTFQYSLEEEMRKRNSHFSITEIKNIIHSKESRIKALEPYYRSNSESLKDSGKIYHAEWMKDKDLEHELLAFPKAKYDDLSDALSMQLDLLMPGSEMSSNPMRPGCWEEALQEAQKLSSPYRDFFTYG